MENSDKFTQTMVKLPANEDNKIIFHTSEEKL